jgi:hypothetical protein
VVYPDRSGEAESLAAGLQAGYGIVAGKIADYLAKLKLPKPESE